MRDDEDDGDVKVSIDAGRCHGHGRCYDLAPEVFTADDEGYSVVRGDGVVPPDATGLARLAALNCPESAVDLVEPGLLEDAGQLKTEASHDDR